MLGDRVTSYSELEDKLMTFEPLSRSLGSNTSKNDINSSDEKG